MQKHLLINGELVAGEGEKQPVYNPATGEVLLEIAEASAAQVDAAVLAAGHCGFGLGATPTAIANMQAITERFGPSHMAFLVVPMVGAFFIDIVNALVIKLYLMLPMFA